ncbi:MAG: hypothetical protein IT275_05530 [Chitinophagales bacterium]|nr:hypothetical protein [Chitinophagales bacterium]
MNTRILIAATAGAILYFLLGWLIYDVLVADYYATHSVTQYYNGLIKSNPSFVGIFFSCFAFTLVLAVIFGNMANITTIKDGALAGTTISLLVALYLNLNIWSMFNMIGKTVVIADSLISAIVGGILGAVIAGILGYKRDA